MNENATNLNDHWHKIEVWADWHKWEAQAVALGLSTDVERLRPDTEAGWRLVDERMTALRELVEKAKEER